MYAIRSYYAHVGQCQGGDDDGCAGGGQPGDKRRGHHAAGAKFQGHAQAAVVHRQSVPQFHARPGDREHGQAEQEQVERQAPTGAAQVPGVVV